MPHDPSRRTSIAHLDVERMMNSAVKSAGGEILDETLPANRPQQNADYVFRQAKVIAELKRCERVIISDENFIDKLSAIHERYSKKWEREGRTDVPMAFGSRALIQVSDYPEEFQIAVSNLLQGIFAGILSKANRQIRATVDLLAMRDAGGLLLLCVDGDTGLTLETLLHVLARLIRRNSYRSIHSILLFSANYVVHLPGTPPVRPILSLHSEDRPSVNRATLQFLASAWADQINIAGGPPPAFVTPHADPRIIRQRLVPVFDWPSHPGADDRSPRS